MRRSGYKPGQMQGTAGRRIAPLTSAANPRNGEKMNTENIKHAGKVRGGCNWHARASVQFYAEDITSEEGAALVETFVESLEWTNKWVQPSSGEDNSAYEFAFDTRREFSLLPLMIRRFAAYGYEARLVMYDRHHDPVVSMVKDPATFWREIALAQMWLKE